MVQLSCDRRARPTPPYLTIDWLLSQFSLQRAAAQRKYQAFVDEGIGQGSPWEELRGQVLLGSERFVEWLAPGLRDKRLLREIPRRQRFAARPTLGQLFGARTRADRVRRNDPFAELILTTAIVSRRSVVPWACTMRRSAALRILRMLFHAHDKSCVQRAP